MEQKKMNNKGFSLVELIIVIAIMAILVGVLAPQFIKYVEKSRVSRDVQNVEEMKTAVEIGVADAGAAGTSISSDITITINGGSTKTTAIGGGATTTGFDLGGVPTSGKLSSGNWPDSTITFTYSCTGTSPTYKWSTTTTTDYKTGDGDMKAVFGL